MCSKGSESSTAPGTPSIKEFSGRDMRDTV